MKIRDTILALGAAATATRKDLERIAGSLSWAAAVVPQGRRFLFFIFTALRAWPRRVRFALSRDVSRELAWWRTAVASFVDLESTRLFVRPRQPLALAYGDASTEVGMGGWLGSQFWSYEWGHDECARIADGTWHIDVLESLCVVTAAFVWAPRVGSTATLVLHTDNSGVQGAFHNSFCRRNRLINWLTGMLAFAQLRYSCHIAIRWVGREDNVAADCLSKQRVGAFRRLRPDCSQDVSSPSTTITRWLTRCSTSSTTDWARVPTLHTAPQ